jgi:hypothetical protein
VRSHSRRLRGGRRQLCFANDEVVDSIQTVPVCSAFGRASPVIADGLVPRVGFKHQTRANSSRPARMGIEPTE